MSQKAIHDGSQSSRSFFARTFRIICCSVLILFMLFTGCAQRLIVTTHSYEPPLKCLVSIPIDCLTHSKSKFKTFSTHLICSFVYFVFFLQNEECAVKLKRSYKGMILYWLHKS